MTGNVSMYNSKTANEWGEGIYLKKVSHSVIENNICQYNDGYGLAFDSSTGDYNIIKGNNFSNNYGGHSVIDSAHGYYLNGANGNGICTLNCTLNA